MLPSRRVPRDDVLEDDYPIRPRSERQEEPNPPIIMKGQLRTTILFCFVYFMYGSGASFYGPLYPKLARKNGLNSCIYGAVIATSHFVCITSYPIACRMVASISCRHSLSVSIFIIGACRMLFGTLTFMSERVPFTAISFSIQAVEGFGMAILLASTIITICSRSEDSIWKISLAIHISLSLGLSVGPIVGEIMKEYLGFDIAFYIVGALTVAAFICTAILLPEPDQHITYGDIPIIVWMKEKRLLIYFLITFATFNYVGFLSVCLAHVLRQFHLKSIYVGLIFSIAPFVYCLSVHGWSWLIRKWFHSVLTMFIGSLLIFGSLVLLGPVPFTTLESSLANVSSALFLAGLGIACKSACVAESSGKDLRNLKNMSNIQKQIIIPTVLCLGIYLGHFAGSLTAGLTDFYIGYRKATLILFALEAFAAVAAVMFSFNRNYVSKRRRESDEETQHILKT